MTKSHPLNDGKTPSVIDMIHMLRFLLLPPASNSMSLQLRGCQHLFDGELILNPVLCDRSLHSQFNSLLRTNRNQREA